MSFCKFSSEFVSENKTSVDNLFINEFLPTAPDYCLKVYLYGLYKCNNANSADNCLESFSIVLGLSPEDIESAFLFWQEKGLVQVLATNPFEVRYMPVKNAFISTKKFSKSKYETFNITANDILSGRMITPNEYYEYYDTMERFHIEIEAMLMIMKYCAEIKGNNVGYSYILTVARAWASENITTAESVEEKLKELEGHTTEVGQVLKELGSKKIPNINEKELYNKWKKEYDFDKNTIIFVAKSLKNSKFKANFEVLDEKLTKYYEMKLLTILEIENYENSKKEMLTCAKEVCKSIGVYYDNLEIVVETYIKNWLDMGYDKKTLKLIATFCFKHSIKTLEVMNTQIQKFFKLGITSEKALTEYVDELVAIDEQIKEILNNLGLSRNVTSLDRDWFKVWINNWNMSKELINEAILISQGKSQPMTYLNKVLSTWHSNNVTTVEEAKKIKINQSNQYSAPKKTNTSREYSKEELYALFDNLDEVDI